MNKSCGNCREWIKLPKIKGLCDKYDFGWAVADHPACEKWKRKRDKPPRNNKVNIEEYEN